MKTSQWETTKRRYVFPPFLKSIAVSLGLEVSLLFLLLSSPSAEAQGPDKVEDKVMGWRHLSSSTGDLPVPGASTEQTGALVADLDKDGTNDFVISFRKVAPAVVWYLRISWINHTIGKRRGLIFDSNTRQ
ncbi:MAG TPA: hypothetical protein VN578_15835 [Candidatus Binatia bacterium]|jgi:hypothetical protein|nr:hypothetical protein [Candidatus Binatia bacterium]